MPARSGSAAGAGATGDGAGLRTGADFAATGAGLRTGTGFAATGFFAASGRTGFAATGFFAAPGRTGFAATGFAATGFATFGAAGATGATGATGAMGAVAIFTGVPAFGAGFTATGFLTGFSAADAIGAVARASAAWRSPANGVRRAAAESIPEAVDSFIESTETGDGAADGAWTGGWLPIFFNSLESGFVVGFFVRSVRVAMIGASWCGLARPGRGIPAGSETGKIVLHGSNFINHDKKAVHEAHVKFFVQRKRKITAVAR